MWLDSTWHDKGREPGLRGKGLESIKRLPMLRAACVIVVLKTHTGSRYAKCQPQGAAPRPCTATHAGTTHPAVVRRGPGPGGWEGGRPLHVLVSNRAAQFVRAAAAKPPIPAPCGCLWAHLQARGDTWQTRPVVQLHANVAPSMPPPTTHTRTHNAILVQRPSPLPLVDAHPTYPTATTAT